MPRDNASAAWTCAVKSVKLVVCRGRPRQFLMLLRAHVSGKLHCHCLSSIEGLEYLYSTVCYSCAVAMAVRMVPLIQGFLGRISAAGPACATTSSVSTISTCAANLICSEKMAAALLAVLRTRRPVSQLERRQNDVSCLAWY